MKSQWITHKGKRIYLIDVSGFGLDHEGMEEAKEWLGSNSSRPES